MAEKTVRLTMQNGRPWQPAAAAIVGMQGLDAVWEGRNLRCSVELRDGTRMLVREPHAEVVRQVVEANTP